MKTRNHALAVRQPHLTALALTISLLASATGAYGAGQPFETHGFAPALRTPDRVARGGTADLEGAWVGRMAAPVVLLPAVGLDQEAPIAVEVESYDGGLGFGIWQLGNGARFTFPAGFPDRGNTDIILYEDVVYIYLAAAPGRGASYLLEGTLSDDGEHIIGTVSYYGAQGSVVVGYFRLGRHS